MAYDFFFGCPNLRHIYGASGITSSNELLVAFHVVLFQSLFSCTDGDTASAAASQATRRNVNYFDGDDHRFTADFEAYATTGLAWEYHDQSLDDLLLHFPNDFDDWRPAPVA